MNEAGKLKRRNLAFIATMIATFLVSYVIVHLTLNTREDNIKISQVLEDQNMLSQRITKLVLLIQNDIYADTIANSRPDSLSRLIPRWQKNHEFLLLANREYAGTSPLGITCDSLLQAASPLVTLISNYGRAMLRDRTVYIVDKAVAVIDKNELPYHALISQCVDLYERELESTIIRLRYQQLMISLVGVTFLILGFAYFIIPIIGHLSKTNTELLETNAALATAEKEARSNLEQIHELKNDLEIREEQYRSLIENASDIIYELNENGKFIFVNTAVEGILGYSAEELTTKYFWEVIHPDYAKRFVNFYLNEVKQQREHSYQEVPVLSKSGDTIWLGQNARMYFDHHRLTRVAVVARDISLKIKAEKDILFAKEQAEAASLAKSDFLANISHEIRTPLNGVIGFTELLMGTPLSETQHQYMTTVNQSAQTLLDIINNVLDFSKIEAGKLDLTLEKADVLTLCAQAADVVSFHAQQKNIDVLTVVGEDVPRFILADALRLRQVLVNLMGNAIKFTEEGEIELKVEKIGPSGSGQAMPDELMLRFSVRDTGIGISPENQQKIFEAFTQADSYTTKKYGGTGLGLTISNKLLELMGSQLQLKSEAGIGSEFYFDIAFRILEGTGLKVESNFVVASQPIIQYKGHTKRILLVEDTLVNRTLAKIIIKNILPDAIILEAVNGIEAITSYEKENPDFIFMDVQMPEMNGYDAAKEIRKMEAANHQTISQPTRIPIIALTAGTIKGEKEKCMENGMDDYVSKPITQGAIQQVLAKWMMNEEC